MDKQNRPRLFVIEEKILFGDPNAPKPQGVMDGDGMPFKAKQLRPLNWQPKPRPNNDPVIANRQYRKLRLKVLAEEPLCMIRGPKCTRISTTADHIKPRAQGGLSVRSNLRGACWACNSGHRK